MQSIYYIQIIYLYINCYNFKFSELKKTNHLRQAFQTDVNTATRLKTNIFGDYVI